MASVAPARGITPVRDIGRPGAALGRVAGEVADRAESLFLREKAEREHAHLVELDLQRRQADREVVQDYLSKSGKEAVDARERAFSSILANARDVGRGVGDEVVRSKWKQQSAALSDSSLAQIDAHYRQESQRWQVSALQNRTNLLVDTVENTALADGYDPSTGTLSLEAEKTRSGYVDTLRELGSRLGWSPEELEVRTIEADTRAYATVAAGLIRQDRFEEADKVLQRYGARIEPGVREQLAERSRNGAQHVRTNEAAFELARAVAATGKPIEEQIAMVDRRVGRETPVEVLGSVVATLPPISVEVRDATVERLQRAAAVEKQAREEKLRNVIAQAEAWLTDNPNQPARALPAMLYDELRRSGRLDQINTFAANHRYSTDPAALAEVRAMSDRGELANLSETEFANRFEHRLDSNDWNYAQALRARSSRVERQDPQQTVTLNDRLHRAAQQLGILPPEGEDVSADQKQAFQKMRFEFNDRLLQWQDAHRRKATDREVAELLDLQVADIVRVDNPPGITSGLLFMGGGAVRNWLVGDSSEHMPLMNVPKEKVGEAYALVGAEKVRTRDIREDVVDALAEDLRLSGKPATFSNIAARWVQMGRPKTAGPQGR